MQNEKEFKRYMMKCGHTNNAEFADTHKPCCVICICGEIDHEVHGNEGLEGRIAKCDFCGAKTESKWDLPFFQYKPDKEFDEYYDGCFGWD